MKKLLAMLLVLCMLCGTSPVMAEKTADDTYVYDFPPVDEMIVCELPYITLSIPTSWKPEFPSDRRGDVRAYPWIQYSNDPTTYTQIDVAFFIEGEETEYRSAASYMRDSYHVSEVLQEKKLGRVQILVFKQQYDLSYLALIDNLALCITFEDYDWLLTYIAQDKLLSICYEQFVYPVISMAQFPDGTAALAPEAEMAGRIKVGNFSFEMPEGMVEQESVRQSKNGFEIAACVADDYQFVLVSVDYKELGLPVNAVADDYQLTHMYWAMQLFRGMSEEQAYEVLQNAYDLPMAKNGETLLMSYTADGMGVYTHYYWGEGFVIFVITAADAAQAALVAGEQMAQSFLLDGVTEEQMAADAEAARIAAEEAAAKAAAQKYIVITGDSANIRSGPGSDHSKVTTARKGDTFPLLGQEGTWYKIDVNGQIGYVAQGLCKVKE